MKNEPEKQSPRKNFKGVAFVIASIGVFCLVGSVEVFRSGQSFGLGGCLFAFGLMLIAGGTFLGVKRP